MTLLSTLALLNSTLIIMFEGMTVKDYHKTFDEIGKYTLFPLIRGFPLFLLYSNIIRISRIDSVHGSVL